MRNVTAGTIRMIMYNQSAKRTLGINHAIKEYWIEKKCSGKMILLQRRALKDGFF
jgi:hypothetical protein